MDWQTLAIGILVIIIGIGAYVWQISNVFFNWNQWYSPFDKTVMITGCDTGIGFQLAKHFYRKGCHVIATVLKMDGDGAKQLKRFAEDKHRMVVIKMDVTKESDVTEATAIVGKVLSDNGFQGLYCLVNNAGVCVMSELDWLTWKQIQSQVEVNLLGTIRVTKAFLPLIIQAKGRIVNVSSVNGNCAYPGISVYSATKYAIEGLSDSLRIELSKFEVKVIVVKPGDYAKLTHIMSGHESHAREMWFAMDENKRQLYGNYFNEYQKSVVKNRGLTSPKSFESSSLFNDFEEAVLAVDPRLYITSASLVFRFLLYFDSVRAHKS